MDDLHEKNISLISLYEGADIEFKEAQGRKGKGTFLAFNLDYQEHEDSALGWMDRVKLHRRDLTLMLYKLVKGYLVNHSPNRRSVYKLGKGSPQLELFNPLGSSIDSDSDSTNYDSSSTNSDSSSTNSDSSSTNSDSSSTNSDARFQRIIKPLANTRRYKTNDVKKAIVALCEVEPLSLRRLAELLNRTPNQVRNYIKPLLADGHLQLLFPENPKHPKQKYSSVKKARIDTPE